MATVIPGKKTGQFGEALGQGLGNLITSGSQAYMNRTDEAALQQAVSGLGPNASARQILDAILGAKTYNQESKQNLLNNYLGAERFDELKRQAQEQEGILREKNELARTSTELKNKLKEIEDSRKAEKELNDSLTLIDSSKLGHDEKEALRERVKKGEASFDAIKEVLKGQKDVLKEREATEAKAVTQKSFNELVKLVPKVGISGLPTSKLGGETAKAYSQFATLTGALESQLVEQVNKGALSNTRFKYITETLLPKPSDSQADIIGKLTGLATMLGLDASALGIGEEQKADSKGRPPLSSFEKRSS